MKKQQNIHDVPSSKPLNTDFEANPFSDSQDISKHIVQKIDIGK